jgi:flavin-dependent dehydrogenase
MKEEFVILGGGVAGLSAANRLAELGASPLLIEGGSYPAHKICGEFFSPSSLIQLEKWHIFPKKIHHANLRTAHSELHLPFSPAAGSLSHYQLDQALAKRAERKGAALMTHTRVEAMRMAKKRSEYHELDLSNGVTIEAKHLLIATGRLPSLTQKTMTPRYIGFKTHFSGLSLKDSLEMFSFPGAYLGITPIENDHFNVAGLAEYSLFKDLSLAELIDSLKRQQPLLNTYLNEGQNLFTEWMQTTVPEFGIKHTPHYPRTYYIGDAAATIPPASGNGLTLAIECGRLAAHYVLKDDEQGFKKQWHSRIRGPIFFAKLLHRVMLNPSYGNPLIWLNSRLPLAHLLYKMTR